MQLIALTCSSRLRSDWERRSRYITMDLLPAIAEALEADTTGLGRVADCISHAMTFFNRPDFDLATATPGTFSLRPVGDMIDKLARDYENTRAMIFGEAPRFENVLKSIEKIEGQLNG